MCVLTDLAATLQTLLTTEAEQAARDTGCLKRVRKLSGASFVQTLVLGWLHDPHASLDSLAEFAADLGADITPRALDQRLTTAATHCLARLLTAALQRLVAAEPLAVPLLRRFAGVHVFDSTVVTLPAALAGQFPGSGHRTAAGGPAALKCQVELELQTGALDLQVVPGREADVRSELAWRPLPAGALRLADRGYLDLGLLADASAAGVYWITRLQANRVIRDARGQRAALAAWLAGCQGDGVDEWVWVGAEDQLPCRLLACRVPRAVAAKRRERLRRQAKKRGREVSALQLTMCAWNACVTNLPAELLRAEEAWVLLRARWQIELLFKLWKSHGGLEAYRGERAGRVLCEVYAKLLGQVVQHWLLLSCGGPCLAYSYTKAARRVRRQALVLAVLLSVEGAVVRLLERLRRRMAKRCRAQKRVGRPSTHELLLDPDRGGVPDEEQQEEETAAQAA
jgi:hypothetical protein